MLIKKFNQDYSRRQFLSSLSKGVISAGVLAPLWPIIGNTGEIDKAYPDELLDIGLYTKGKIKVGDVITADNVEYVKDLLDPIAYQQVSQMGRRINIVETTRDVTKLFPARYLEATLRNEGKAAFDANGNVVTKDGNRWIGGNPFPNPKTAEEVTANITLSWGRHDQTINPIRDHDIGPDGNVEYQYDFVWTEMNTAGLVSNDGNPYMDLGFANDKLRFNSVWFTHPNDSKGTSFLNIWHYDQSRYPDLYGYLPAFKRVRRFPTNQRFEPLAPGMTLFLSDAWGTGDPMLTWGNYKIIGRGPFLGAQSRNFQGAVKNREAGVHGGPKDQTFIDINMELCPDVLVIEAEPTGYPRAPVSKKRFWVDLRNGGFIAYNTYDRRGELWKTFEPAFSQYKDGEHQVLDSDGNPEWSWTSVMIHDIQTNRMTRYSHTKEVRGGFLSEFDMGPDSYNKYFTVQAIRRLGT